MLLDRSVQSNDFLFQDNAIIFMWIARSFTLKMIRADVSPIRPSQRAFDLGYAQHYLPLSVPCLGLQVRI